MIFFFPAGQLGNQIFQYSYLKDISTKDEVIITSHCEFFDVFESVTNNYIFLNRYLRFIIRRIVTFLVFFKIISQVSQKKNFDSEGNEYFEAEVIVKLGLLFWIKNIEGFFQSECFVKSYTTPKLKDEFIIDAKKFLEQVPTGMKKVFVHIRRGDYLDWNILGDVNPSLPLKYYEEVIGKILNEHAPVTFIFLSDDTKFVEKTFAHIENKLISRNSVAVDYGVMVSCDIGILSNSTLSWWGAYSMGPGSFAYAPQYWLGWKRKIWYPSGIETDKFKYIMVR